MSDDNFTKPLSKASHDPVNIMSAHSFHWYLNLIANPNSLFIFCFYTQTIYMHTQVYVRIQSQRVILVDLFVCFNNDGGTFSRRYTYYLLQVDSSSQKVNFRTLSHIDGMSLVRRRECIIQVERENEFCIHNLQTNKCKCSILLQRKKKQILQPFSQEQLFKYVVFCCCFLLLIQQFFCFEHWYIHIFIQHRLNYVNKVKRCKTRKICIR